MQFRIISVLDVTDLFGFSAREGHIASFNSLRNAQQDREHFLWQKIPPRDQKVARMPPLQGSINHLKFGDEFSKMPSFMPAKSFTWKKNGRVTLGGVRLLQYFWSHVGQCATADCHGRIGMPNLTWNIVKRRNTCRPGIHNFHVFRWKPSSWNQNQSASNDQSPARKMPKGWKW